jgi:hypothetical protein
MDRYLKLGAEQIGEKESTIIPVDSFQSCI